MKKKRCDLKKKCLTSQNNFKMVQEKKKCLLKLSKKTSNFYISKAKKESEHNIMLNESCDSQS